MDPIWLLAQWQHRHSVLKIRSEKQQLWPATSIFKYLHRNYWCIWVIYKQLKLVDLLLASDVNFIDYCLIHASHVESTAANVRECFMLSRLEHLTKIEKQSVWYIPVTFIQNIWLIFKRLIHGKWLVSLVAQECFLFLLLHLEFCTCFTYISYFK